MKKNILIITQKVDEKDLGVLSFFIVWLREFSKKFSKVFVISLYAGEYNLPSNVFVYSLGKEKGTPKLLRFLKFYFYLFKLVPKSNGIFAHMSPIFAVAAWPAAFLFRRRMILWYLHRSVTFRLKLAEKLCYRIVTSTKESLNLNIKSRKIVQIGHGIDVEKFKTKREWSKRNLSKELNILSVGRISEIKDYETLIKAGKIFKNRGLRFNLEIIGSPIMPNDFAYFEKLKKITKDLDLQESVKFIDFIPYGEKFFDYFKKADIFINLAPTGGIDKVVLEAMASGSLILVSNLAFKKYLGVYDLFFNQGDSNDLADKIFKLTNLPNEEIKKISDFLVRSVSSHHRLENAIARISALL